MPQDEQVSDDATMLEASQLKEAQPESLPDEDAQNGEKQQKQTVEELTKQLNAEREEKTKLEQRLKDNQQYISRTRNLDKETEQPARPQKTLDDYLGEVTKQFEDNPVEGLKKVVRDIAYDRDLERQEYEKRITLAEERAFKKSLALNPETAKTMKLIEDFDEAYPDMSNLPIERKIEFANFKKAATASADNGDAARERISREVGLSGRVAGSSVGTKGTKIPAWVDDPDVMREAQGRFKSKQEMLAWADEDGAKRLYEQRRSQKR